MRGSPLALIGVTIGVGQTDEETGFRIPSLTIVLKLYSTGSSNPKDIDRNLVHQRIQD